MSVIQQNEASQYRSGTDFGVDDIAEAPINLMTRKFDSLVVNLWLVEATARQYITVEDSKGLAEDELVIPQHLEIPEGHNPLNKNSGRFWHPMSHLVD